ncbi:MAG: hypothetical protein DWG77_04595 [Chloroflexi bacterium]|nr:hypothetical protein [Chloroflexota bacterium]
MTPGLAGAGVKATSGPRASERMPEYPRRLYLSARALVLLAGVAALLVSVSGILVFRSVSDGGPDVVVLPAPDALLAFAEFGLTADRVFVAPATDPDARALVATIEHADGWGINPTISPTGLIAYTVLAPGVVADRDTPAELWLLNLSSGEAIRLASDADLLVAPVFTRDSDALVYRRSTGLQQELVRLEIATGIRATIHVEQTSFGIFPVGFNGEDALLFARLSTDGTDLLSVTEGEVPTHLLRASQHVARDWRVSPDGRAVAFLAPEPILERIVHRARIVDLSTLEDRRLPDALSTDGEQYGPTWTPDGALTVGQEADVAVATPAAILRFDDDAAPVLPPPDLGFDVPVEWSPDGRFLAARTLSGVNSVDPGNETAVIIGADGSRRAVTAPTEVILIGWYVRG